jgi:hypothetical protein
MQVSVDAMAPEAVNWMLSVFVALGREAGEQGNMHR